jgi:hypothetical protein
MLGLLGDPHLLTEGYVPSPIEIGNLLGRDLRSPYRPLSTLPPFKPFYEGHLAENSSTAPLLLEEYSLCLQEARRQVHSFRHLDYPWPDEVNVLLFEGAMEIIFMETLLGLLRGKDPEYEALIGIKGDALYTSLGFFSMWFVTGLQSTVKGPFGGNEKMGFHLLTESHRFNILYIRLLYRIVRSIEPTFDHHMVEFGDFFTAEFKIRLWHQFLGQIEKGVLVALQKEYATPS